MREGIPGKVRRDAGQETKQLAMPGPSRQSWRRPGREALRQPTRSEREQRLLEDEVEGHIGQEPGRYAKQQRAGQIMPVLSLEQGHDIPGVRNHGADGKRGRHRSRTQHSRQRYDGGGMSERVRQERLLWNEEAQSVAGSRPRTPRTQPGADKIGGEARLREAAPARGGDRRPVVRFDAEHRMAASALDEMRVGEAVKGGCDPASAKLRAYVALVDVDDVFREREPGAVHVRCRRQRKPAITGELAFLEGADAQIASFVRRLDLGGYEIQRRVGAKPQHLTLRQQPAVHARGCRAGPSTQAPPENAEYAYAGLLA